MGKTDITKRARETVLGAIRITTTTTTTTTPARYASE